MVSSAGARFRGIPELNTFVSSPNADSRSVAEARLFIANPIRARTPFALIFPLPRTTIKTFRTRRSAARSSADFGYWCRVRDRFPSFAT